MSAVAINSDFWIAVTTVGPILALANTVTMTNVGRAYLDRAAAEQKRDLLSGHARPINTTGWKWRQTLAMFNYLVQAGVTIMALLNLLGHTNSAARFTLFEIFASFAVIGLLALFAGEDAVATRRALAGLPG